MSTDLLPSRTEPETDHEDPPYAHYAEEDKVTEAYVMGTPIVALCGKVWVPSRDPEGLEVCPECKRILDEINNSGNN